MKQKNKKTTDKDLTNRYVHPSFWLMEVIDKSETLCRVSAHRTGLTAGIDCDGVGLG